MAADDKDDRDQGAAPSALAACVRVVMGRPLANRESGSEAIGIAEGVPALGLDGLSSTAYGPEAALAILGARAWPGSPRSARSCWSFWCCSACLFVSYWQTIEAYPKSGGAYSVAKANLGVNASLLAVAALMIDYVLNVAVGISAGVAALISAAPELHPYTLPALSRHFGRC